MAKKRITKWDKAFVQGYICACSTLIQKHGISTEVEDCLKGVDINIETLKAHDVDEYDLNVIRPVIKEIERKRAWANALQRFV